MLEAADLLCKLVFISMTVAPDHGWTWGWNAAFQRLPVSPSTFLHQAGLAVQSMDIASINGFSSLQSE